MRPISKTKLIAYRQCPKKLWLEVHKPQLRQDSASTLERFAVSHRVGELAQQLYDPDGNAQVIDVDALGFGPALDRTQELLGSTQVIFEAAVNGGGAVVFVDALLPVQHGPLYGWRMVEIKASGTLKSYHRDDVAIQTYALRESGVPLLSTALAHIDTSWEYPGGGDYQGLLKEVDLTIETFSRAADVRTWISGAQQVLASNSPPTIQPGPHCTHPHECGFIAHCRAQQRPSTLLTWVPPGTRHSHLAAHAAASSRSALSPALVYSARQALTAYPLPAHFVDISTVQFAIPEWAGTRPFQRLPFQFSTLYLGPNGTLEQRSFIDTSGADPSETLTDALLAACHMPGPLFVADAGAVSTLLYELGLRLPEYAMALQDLRARLVNLMTGLPHTDEPPSHHTVPNRPAQWEAVLNELAPRSLDGLQDADMAARAFQRACAAETPAPTQAQYEQQLQAYGNHNAFALLRAWSLLTS